MNELEKRAAYHRKRQKGLPRTGLNPDAGNVEHNINMFNMIATPNGGPSNSPSGPMGGDASFSGGMGESLNPVKISLNIKESADGKEMVDLYYENLEFEQNGPVNWDGDYDSWDVTVDWTIEVEREDIETFLFESCIDETDVSNWGEMSDEEAIKWVSDNFEELFEKYHDLILDYWRDDAIDDAQEKYDANDYVDWDSMPGGHDDIRENLGKVKFDNLDDDFDLFLRGI